MKKFLETPRLILRQIEPDDSELIRELDSDPEVVRFISNGVPSDDKEIKRAMGVFMDLREKHHDKLGFFPAHLKSDNEFIGWFHLRPLKSAPDDITRLELGYRLRRKFWGMGLATEGSKALVDLGLQMPEVSEILAHAMSTNKGSISVMKKVGMSFISDDIYEAWPGDDKRCVWYGLKRS